MRLREGRGSTSCTAPPRLDKHSTTASSRPRSGTCGREATCQGKRRGHVSWREDGPKALIREWHTPPRSHDTPPRKEEEEEEKQQFPDVPVSFHSSSSSPICPFLAFWLRLRRSPRSRLPRGFEPYKTCLRRIISSLAGCEFLPARCDLDTSFCSNDSLGRPQLHSPSLACRVFLIKETYLFLQTCVPDGGMGEPTR